MRSGPRHEAKNPNLLAATQALALDAARGAVAERARVGSDRASRGRQKRQADVQIFAADSVSETVIASFCGRHGDRTDPVDEPRLGEAFC